MLTSPEQQTLHIQSILKIKLSKSVIGVNLNLKDPMIPFGFFYKLTPRLIKYNTLTHDWISLPALGGTGVFSHAL